MNLTCHHISFDSVHLHAFDIFDYKLDHLQNIFLKSINIFLLLNICILILEKKTSNRDHGQTNFKHHKAMESDSKQLVLNFKVRRIILILTCDKRKEVPQCVQTFSQDELQFLFLFDMLYVSVINIRRDTFGNPIFHKVL